MDRSLGWTKLASRSALRALRGELQEEEVEDCSLFKAEPGNGKRTFHYALLVKAVTNKLPLFHF